MGAQNSNRDYAGPDYAGDMTCSQAWEILKEDPKARLIDVRTQAEWTFVGVPDLGAVKRPLLTVEWQSYPAMDQNPGFVAETAEQVAAAGADKDSPLLFICRSGGRSRAAAKAMARAGYSRAFNVAGGFEGDIDTDGHRGTSSGWKACGLPWHQS